MRYLTRFRALPVTFALAVASVAMATAQSKGPVATYTALAVDAGANVGQATMTLDFVVNRWSTEAEKDLITTTLSEQPTKLLDVLQKMPAVGRLAYPGGVGFELRYASLSISGGTERIVFLTDRPIGWGEAANRGRTLDYPFTVMELRVPPSGNGEGRIMVAAKIMVNRTSKDLMIEDYNIAPVQLRGVKKLK